MNLENVKFTKSIISIENRPDLMLPEIVVVGRSNVGKSSLINSIFNRKNLAKISSIPGKTRVINYFSVDNLMYLVDLPGYGYAKISKSQHRQWQSMIETFLRCNKYIKLVLLLIDSRHNLMEADNIMIEWLKSYHIPFVLIMTKRDKISNNKFNIQYRYYCNLFTDIKVIPFSIKTAEGRKEIIRIIKDIIK